MAALLGAFKGLSRGVVLLVLVALLPGLAWLIATYTDGAFGLGFMTIFFVVLGLEVFLGITALFGIASEVQESHSRSMDERSRERSH